MRKFISVLLLFAVVFSVPMASAQAGDTSGMACGDSLTWVVDGSTLYISGSGDMYDFSDSAPWAGFRSTITRLVVEDGVTSIGANAFNDFDALTDVSIGNSVAVLGEKAFYSCDGLTSLVLPVCFRQFGPSCLRACPNLKSVYCRGGFPSFKDSCLWNDYVVVYYPTNNPWNEVPKQQLIQNFGGHLDLIPYDMSQLSSSAPSAPSGQTAQAPAATTPTEAPLDAPIVIDRPGYVLETMPVQTVPTLTEPVPTVPPQTQPVETQPIQTLPTETQPVQTVPVQTQPANTEPATFPTRATVPYDEPEDETGLGSEVGILIIAVTLLIVAFSALIFQLTKRRGTKKRRRRR